MSERARMLFFWFILPLGIAFEMSVILVVKTYEWMEGS